MTALARPAQFDRSQQGRRALLAKVHIAKKQLGLSEDDYRAIVFDHVGSFSAGDASEEQLRRLVGHFERRGFKPVARSVPGRRAPAASHPSARKARAMWISLHHLGAVRNPSEQALEAFACRQLGCEHWRWSDQGLSYRLIEALKAMAERHGWAQDGNPKPHVIKRRLCAAILHKLVENGVAHADWSIERALFSLAGETMPDIDTLATDDQLSTAAAMLGRILAAHSSHHQPEA